MKKLILILLFPLMANAGIVSDVSKALGEPKVIDGNGCEVREWVEGAFIGCYGTQTGDLEPHAATLLAKGYRVTRQGKALVVVK